MYIRSRYDGKNTSLRNAKHQRHENCYNSSNRYDI